MVSVPGVAPCVLATPTLDPSTTGTTLWFQKFQWRLRVLCFPCISGMLYIMLYIVIYILYIYIVLVCSDWISMFNVKKTTATSTGKWMLSLPAWTSWGLQLSWPAAPDSGRPIKPPRWGLVPMWLWEICNFHRWDSWVGRFRENPLGWTENTASNVSNQTSKVNERRHYVLHCGLTRVGDLCGIALRSCKCFGNWEFFLILILLYDFQHFSNNDSHNTWGVVGVIGDGHLVCIWVNLVWWDTMTMIALMNQSKTFNNKWHQRTHPMKWNNLKTYHEHFMSKKNNAPSLPVNKHVHAVFRRPASLSSWSRQRTSCFFFFDGLERRKSNLSAIFVSKYKHQEHQEPAPSKGCQMVPKGCQFTIP